MRQWMTMGMMIRLEEGDNRMRQQMEEMKDMVPMQIQIEIEMHEIHTIRMTHMRSEESMTARHPKRRFSV